MLSTFSFYRLLCILLDRWRTAGGKTDNRRKTSQMWHQTGKLNSADMLREPVKAEAKTQSECRIKHQTSSSILTNDHTPPEPDGEKLPLQYSGDGRTLSPWGEAWGSSSQNVLICTVYFRENDVLRWSQRSPRQCVKRLPHRLASRNQKQEVKEA